MDFGPEWVRFLKSSWHRFVVAHLDEILTIFYRYDYQSLVKADIKDFTMNLVILFSIMIIVIFI